MTIPSIRLLAAFCFALVSDWEAINTNAVGTHNTVRGAEIMQNLQVGNTYEFRSYHEKASVKAC